MSDTDILKMKVADLKRELKLRGLTTTGNKNELQERLQGALIDGDLSLDDTAISEAGLLDDDVLTDEEDKSPLDLRPEVAALQLPPKISDKPSLGETTVQKKVVLKRTISHTIAPPPPDPVAAAAPSSISSLSTPPEKIAKIEAPSDDTSGADKKVIKLSELSVQERLEMRAKKFGVPLSSEASKIARAERFKQGNITTSDTNKLSSNGGIAPQATMEVLKKRAERFGCSVSSKMTELEKNEKLLKRQQRFGSGNNNKITTEESNGASATGTDYAEKAKQRLERFKTAVK